MVAAILTINAGSSSIKFALFEISEQELHLVSRGLIEGIGTAPHLTARGSNGAILTEHRWVDGADLGHEAFQTSLFEWADEHLGGDKLVAVGHRVVHGGAEFERPTAVSQAVLEKLDALSPLAPLHQPHNLAAIRAAQVTRPNLPQVACFDTAFHHGQAEVVTRFALPRVWRDEGVRRYGFHGLSYEFVSKRLRSLDPKLAEGRVLIAHLGNGASLCAVHNGKSVDTTMGFTALDGLVMGTRCGAIDPGVILYLQQQAGMTPEAVQALLYEKSGLLGVSGLSSDMRALLGTNDPNAKAAVDLFTFRIARETGALMASMGGLDGFVFTAGIGENAPEIRASVADRLAWAGFEIDPEANERGSCCISTAASARKIWVVPTDEETMIAHHTLDLISNGAGC